MDEFISKCVKMADIFAKINDKAKIRKILTEDGGPLCKNK